MNVLIEGLVVHVIFFACMFDTYFRSPILEGLDAGKPLKQPPAERLVLFVGDGLRMDKLLEFTNSTTESFFRQVMKTRGSWGVSHTRVPTESRPGHVAMTAGLWEDPSAITKGWQENPLNFDTVFNRSRYTWAWGSPDIVSMFDRGQKSIHIWIDTYDTGVQDFAGRNPMNLDEWVFDKVHSFLDDAVKNNTLRKMLDEDRVVLFLHLLGLDTSGHSRKPASKYYMKHIAMVDQGIKEIVDRVERFWSDNGTAFIFTADHGMTDWGSHGAGTTVETETPVLAWGAGIKQDARKRQIKQVDIAALMSALIGVSPPVNSQGIVPVDLLSVSHEYAADVMMSNTQQILRQYHRRHDDLKRDTLGPFFTPFPDLTPDDEARFLRKINDHRHQEQHSRVVSTSRQLCALALKGLQYYGRYHQTALLTTTVLGFIGWIAMAVLPVSRLHPITLPVALLVAIFLIVQRSPLQYFAYFELPVFLWGRVLNQRKFFANKLNIALDRRNRFSCALSIFIGFGFTEILIVSFTERWVLSVGLVMVGLGPLLTSLRRSHLRLTLAWLFSHLLLTAFPLLPTVGRGTNYLLVLSSGMIGTTLPITFRKYHGYLNKFHWLQAILLLIASCTVFSTSKSIAAGAGLPSLNQVIAWATLVCGILLIKFGASPMADRLVSLLVGVYTGYILLCITHEAVFGLLLAVTMVLWLMMEHAYTHPNSPFEDQLTMDTIERKFCSSSSFAWCDARRGLLVLFYLVVSFFGVGNIASINSFDPVSVYCFLTVFSPWLMGGLMILKILMPFLMVTAAFVAIQQTLQRKGHGALSVVLVLSDVMSLQFLLQVRNEGSWLDIGMSISHYVITMATTAALLLLSALAAFIMSPLSQPKSHIT